MASFAAPAAPCGNRVHLPPSPGVDVTPFDVPPVRSLDVGALPFRPGYVDKAGAAIPSRHLRNPDHMNSSFSPSSSMHSPSLRQHCRIRWVPPPPPPPPRRHSQHRETPKHARASARIDDARGLPPSSPPLCLPYATRGGGEDGTEGLADSSAVGSPSPWRRASSGGRAMTDAASSSSTSTSTSQSFRHSFPTSAITHISTGHGRRRRQQRGIAVRDLQAAVKYGLRRPGGRAGTSLYEYNGIAYVVEDATGREVTSYVLEEQLFNKYIDADAERRHLEAVEKIRSDRSAWRSHSVVLVDTSGSMRNSDVRGARSRLGAVWVSLAQDFIAQRICSGTATDMDVVTVILMGSRARTIISEAPTDWSLYNRILRIHHEDEVLPCGHGFYAPAIESAGKILLESSDSSSCALMLWILSDGRPSDSYLNRTSFERSAESLTTQVRNLASQLGRRLTVATIGMGSDVKGDFAALREMANAAMDYSSQGTFQLPSMTSSGLAAAVSSVATSLTMSQTALEGGYFSVAKRQKRVRAIARENRKHVPLWTEVVNKDEFDLYMGEKVMHMVYDTSVEGKFRQVPLQHPNARGVAIRKIPFGEGQERFAYQFFEIAEDEETVVGEPLVAKESRFIEDVESAQDLPSDEFGRTPASWESRDMFVKRFCRIQRTAEDVTNAFNEKLTKIKNLDPNTARVSFLGCSVYYLEDDVRGQFAVLVERRLDGKFKKWNSNNGWHIGQKRRCDALEPVEESCLEVAEEEDGREVIYLSDGGTEDVFVNHSEVAQAFSHFSYVFSGNKYLICDLQGVFSRMEKQLFLTDPVIHYHDLHKHVGNKRQIYGRTDLGRKGIHKFFASHECNQLCKLVTRGYREPHPSKRQKAN